MSTSSIVVLSVLILGGVMFALGTTLTREHPDTLTTVGRFLQRIGGGYRQ